MSTPEQLAELERLEREATKGPWEAENTQKHLGNEQYAAWEMKGPGGVTVLIPLQNGPGTLRFIAAMRNALPSLLAAARRLGEVEAAMRDLAESGRRAEDERCAQLTTANARIAKLEAERDEVDLDETLAALAAVRTRAAAAERRVAELERAAEDRRQELESERAAKNHALATVRANLDAAERRVAELEAKNAQLAHEGDVLGALYVGDAPPKDAARAIVERAQAAERARDEALAKLTALEAEARADKALIKRITVICDDCPGEGHCEFCNDAGVVPHDARLQRELEAVVDAFPDDLGDDEPWTPSQGMRAVVAARDEALQRAEAAEALVLEREESVRDRELKADTSVAEAWAQLRREKAELRAQLARAEELCARAIEWMHDRPLHETSFANAVLKYETTLDPKGVK